MQNMKSEMVLQEGFFATSSINFCGRLYKHRSQFGDVDTAHAKVQVHLESNPTELSYFLLQLDDLRPRMASSSCEALGQTFFGSLSTNHFSFSHEQAVRNNFQYFSVALGENPQAASFYKNGTEYYEYIDIGMIACNPMATTELGLLVTMEFFFCVVDIFTTYRRKATGNAKHRLLRMYSKTLKNLRDDADDILNTTPLRFTEAGFNYAHDMTDSIIKLFQFCCTTSYVATKSDPDFDGEKHGYKTSPFFASKTFRHLVRIKSIADNGSYFYTPTWFNKNQPSPPPPPPDSDVKSSEILTPEPVILMSYSERKAEEIGSEYPKNATPTNGFRVDIPHYETNLKIGQSRILYDHARDCMELVESISRFVALTSVSCHTDLGVLLACRRYLNLFARRQREAMQKTIELTRDERELMRKVNQRKESFHRIRQRNMLLATRRSTLRTLALRHQTLMSRILVKLYSAYLEHSLVNMPRSACNQRMRFFGENDDQSFENFFRHKQSEFRQLLAENTSNLFDTLTVYESTPKDDNDGSTNDDDDVNFDITRRPHNTFYKG
jgi:hypothetical protein